MYCSSCGEGIKQGVIFCTRCGTRANGVTDHAVGKLSESSFNTLVGGMMGIPIAGLGIMIGLIAVMKETGFSKGLMIVFTALSFLLLVAAEAVFIWLLLHNRARTVQEGGDQAQLKKVETKELGEAKVWELAQPMTSVTENTTRAFEPIPRESKI